MVNEIPPLPTPGHPYDLVHSVEVSAPIRDSNHEFWTNEHPTDRSTDHTGPYPAMNQGNNGPGMRYSNVGPEAPDGLPHPVTVLTGHRGNQNYGDGHSVGQYIPITPSQLRHEYYPTAVAPVPNNRPPSRGPLPRYVAGPSQANLNTVHSGISAADDLKHLASQYLYGPGSHIDKLRVKRSRSGTFKVMILLEVEDAV